MGSPGHGATRQVAGEPRARPEASIEARRQAAHRRDVFDHPGARPVANLALDEQVTGWPDGGASDGSHAAALAIDGDDDTGWRGAGAGPWRWSLPFRRVVHLGLLRMLFGRDAASGVPAAFRWEIQPPVGGRCEPGAPWVPLPGGRRDDRDGNVFVHGPREVHAQRQALFADADACALRLEVEAMEDANDRPLLRELRLLEGAPSLAVGAHAEASSSASGGLLGRASPAGAVDGTYEGLWAGQPGAGAWELTVRLPVPRLVDRLGLVLGLDAVTVDRDGSDRRPGAGSPGRFYQGAHLPLAYEVATSHDDDPAHLVALPEAAAPGRPGAELPVRRRLVRLATPRPVKLVRLTIHQATGPWGEAAAGVAAPVVRELSLYGADDPRPVVTPPVFWSVNANPAALTAEMPGGEAFADGLFARTAYHRLRRVLLGFDADSRWPADASRPRDAGTGRFLEVIEGDDRRLDEPLVAALSPPPVLLLSGALDWEFDQRTGRPSSPWAGHPHHWRWDADAAAAAPDAGMGQLRALVQRRRAPLVGFCGGAQILALLESTAEPSADGDRDGATQLDRVLLRNDNRPIRGLLTRREPYERAWWYDPPALDARRPAIEFAPGDPLLGAALDGRRAASLELPSSHGDMLRASAFAPGGPLGRLELVAWSHFCRDWVDPGGLEPTWVDPADERRRCVRVPQAFRSRPGDGYPLVGFQFHPEQRDFTRLAPGSPPEARGDALNLVASTVDLILEAYARLYWPRS